MNAAIIVVPSDVGGKDWLLLGILDFVTVTLEHASIKGVPSALCMIGPVIPLLLLVVDEGNSST